jgi:hypothetical protein
MRILLEILKDGLGEPVHELSVQDDNGKSLDAISICSLEEYEAKIGECLVDGPMIISLMKLAYKAGKDNEDLKIETLEELNG